MRTLLWMVSACTVGFVAALALWHYGPRNTGVTIAVLAAVVLGIELLNAVRR